MTTSLALQTSFLDGCSVADALEALATESDTSQRGAVFTKPEIVEFILDLAGYTEGEPLASYRLLEPSFGNGDFLLPVLRRLLVAAEREGKLTLESLEPAIRSVELHRATYERTRILVEKELLQSGLSRQDARCLCDAWLIEGDFLLEYLPTGFTHVVGNPPYVRQESIPDVLMEEYRRRFATIYDRADLYVPFIERSLGLLGDAGQLAFICADRWMKNRYGKKLRELVSRDFHLRVYVDMAETNAFQVQVSAYPAITIIEKGRAGATRVCANPAADKVSLKSVTAELTAPSLPTNSAVREIRDVTADSEPWVLNSFDELALVRRLEARFPSIEEAGCQVGIGVATGADKAFVGDFKDIDVEVSRKLPLVMTRDIVDGTVSWRGKGVVNPFGDDGKLVDLTDFPRLHAYMERRRDVISGRHVALKNPNGWYRTIDRINSELTSREKLLIPDIKGDASIVYDQGDYYPHHNLYFITCSDWDVRALQAVLSSGIARLFVSLYSTRLRGGYLRFQAQYLRRIRIPRWADVDMDVRIHLKRHNGSNDKRKLREVVSKLYGLGAADWNLVEGNCET